MTSKLTRVAPEETTQVPSRRAFLKTSAMAVAAAGAAGALAACRTEEAKAGATAGAAAGAMAHDTHAPVTPAGAPAALSLAERRRKADEMDAMHEKGVKAFPAKTEGKGNQLLKPRIENGV